MNAQAYWLNLHRGFEQSMAGKPGPTGVDENVNLTLSVACALAALILLIVGGYRIGFEAIHDAGLHLPAVVIEALSELGETPAAVCLSALLAKRRPRVLWMGVLATVYAVAITHVLKRLCDTARPPAVLGNSVVVTGHALQAHSFPSGHTVTAFLLAACFSVGAPRRTKILLYSLAAAVGVSRVWVGAHWPIDVITGAGIAGLSVTLAVRTTRLANWGAGLGAHLLFVSLIALCAVLEATRAPEHLCVRLLAIAITACSLFVLTRDYVLRPLWGHSAVAACG